ncbi:T9SS sorting signal type C domain-containing protein [Flavobacterium urocaniciphilum]|uniref:Por secretion system C-terminal sorting domain-containing protein n=1 Tax=Flavobacterium urocaniciphilum TaxID=1299341 RepID=A0A1H9AV61_9FLAO|nr:T9SS sorting signal type C domain-containing protein [Flavobacterium urocaniciphilum]SEP80425.1 Por secretion system C-terminal sorting domain-containing protein [Flavobacterium urocaniciphilum]
MKKILLINLMVAFTSVVNAQLFVKDGSYVYMTNQYMTVMQDVNLNNTGNFYLRNTSQLLQKGSGASVNSGTGKLSVFQEGTVNNFQYNYWCSPVGSGAAGNPFGITLLNRPTGLTSSTAAEILPTNNYNGTATGGAGSTMQIAPYWIWKFVSLSPVYANWQYVGNAVTLNPGEGFTMKGTSGTDALVADASESVANKTGAAQRYDFRGRPNDGNISVTVSNGNLTLVGNPYSSAINLNMYLVEHTGRQYDGSGNVSAGGNPNVIDGSAYFWEHSKTANTHLLAGYVGGYGTYVANGVNVGTPGTWTSATWNTYNGDGTLNTTGASSGSNFKRQFSPIGQGFMVKGIAAGSSIMKNAYRVFVREGVANNSTFEKNANVADSNTGTNWYDIPNVAGIDYTQISNLPVPQIKLLAVLNNAKSVEVAMAFNPNTTESYDLGYDGVSPEIYANAPDMVYFGQNNNEKKCVITTLPFNIEARIPIAFKCAADANIKLSVKDIINFYDSENVYIFDKQSGIYYDIKNAEFSMNIPAGENNNRFEITFKNYDALSNDINLAVNAFEVFQNNENSMLTIVNTQRKEIESCQLYDVAGKLVLSKKNLGKNDLIELSTNSLNNGVYIVKLLTNDKVTVEKKVIVAN